MLLLYRINSSQRLKAIVSLLPDLCNACVLCRPCPTLNHKVVLHSCPLIYVSRIKRHGLYRSAVTFLYSHRHSWRTAGWSGKRFMAQTRPGSLKLWQALLPPLPLSLPSPCSPLLLHPLSNQNTERGRRASQSGASPKAERHIAFGQSVQLQLLVRDNENMDTTDTLWLFLAESRNRTVLLNDNLYKHQKLIYSLIDLRAAIYSLCKYKL